MESTKLKTEDFLFDPRRVHIRDVKSKQIVEKRPYRLICHKGQQYYEYPVSSGNLWYKPDVEAGRAPEPAGRIVKGQIDEKAVHVEFKAPVTEADLLHVELAKAKQENDKILNELAAIKKEQLASKTAEGKKATAVKAENKNV